VTFTPPLNNFKLTPPLARTIFQLRDDVSNELPQQSDRPGIQRWTMANNGTPEDPTDDYPLNRAYTGGYTWLATVTPTNFAAHTGLQPADPRHGSFLYDVSVAVFARRETIPTVATERLLDAELGPGGDLLLYWNGGGDGVIDPALEGIRGGQWIVLAGVHPTSGKFLLRWYRLLSIDDETGDVRMLSAPGTVRRGRNAMIDGPDWPTTATLPVATNLRAILLPGVIGVNTQTVKLNVE
jgi:hypothetical protein